MTSIEKSAFLSCDSLTNVYYNGTIEEWCNITFSDSASTPMEYAENFYMKNESNEGEEVTEIIIPNTIIEIGGLQFYGFNNVTSIEIPSSVTSIGRSAFYNCKNLKEIILPKNITTIQDAAFYNCTSLTIYCEAISKPFGWHFDWNYSNRPVVWGYTLDE